MNALAYRVPALRLIMFSGEVMPPKHLRKLQKYLPDTTYVNLYGPTEITCNCTYYVLDREFADGEIIPIGVPFRNERVFLLDENDREVTAPGQTGELCVSGTAVARGYWRDPERTRAVFTENPLNPSVHDRIYRTGDLIRIADDGQWLYVSRKDFQIKHMGHRIELGEIKGKKICPSHSLAMSLLLHPDFCPRSELDHATSLAYLRREAIRLDASMAQGYVLITHQGIPLGFVNNLGNRSNNLYPEYWKIRQRE